MTRRGGVLALVLLLTPLALSAADDGGWRVVPREDALRRELMFPNSVFLQLGFHFFPVMTFDAGLTPTAHGERVTRDDFERTLYEGFRSRDLAGASFELGYGRRFHKHFGIQAQGGFVNQRTERRTAVYHDSALVKYQYVGGFVLALAQARFPVSKLDFAIGVGPQVSLAYVRFVVRGSTTWTDPDTQVVDADGFRVEDEERLLVGVGGAAQAAMEYRIRDNWGVQIEYRYAMVPATFHGHAFDQGGHYGLIANYFHF